MKKVFFYLCVCVCVAACSSPSNDLEAGEEPDPKDSLFIYFNFSRGYDHQPMTRAALAGTVTRLDVWVYNGETEEAVVHQSSADENFGTVAVNLDKTKTYQLYAMAHKCDAAATLSDGVISFADDKVKDTFWYTTTVSPESATNYSCEMSRIVAAFRIETTDAVPATAKKMRITQCNVYDRWSVTTGATHQLDRISTLNISSTNADGTAVFTVYSINTDAETLHNITVEALDANDNVIQSRTFANVPLRNGYKTTYCGEFFTNTNTSAAFTLTPDWNSYDVVNF